MKVDCSFGEGGGFILNLIYQTTEVSLKLKRIDFLKFKTVIKRQIKRKKRKNG